MRDVSRRKRDKKTSENGKNKNWFERENPSVAKKKKSSIGTKTENKNQGMHQTIEKE